MKVIRVGICAAGLAAAMNAGAQVVLTGSDLSGVGLTVPATGVGGSGSATYSSASGGQITLISDDSVGGGSFSQFQDTANITVNNGYDGVTLGTLNGLLTAAAAGQVSFDLASATAYKGQYAYWDIDINIGGTIYQINSYGDNQLGANPFPYNSSASVGYSSTGTQLPFSFGTTWATLASTYGNDDVTAVTIDVGGWDTGESQTNVITSITLPGTYVAPVPEPATLISALLMVLPCGATALRILRRRQMI